MLCLDVNVLVYAHRADLPDNERYGPLLETWANGSEPLGLSGMVLSGFLRIVTNRRVFAEPTSPADAYLAAYALDNNATFVSADRRFARFSHLKWRHPLDA